MKKLASRSAQTPLIASFIFRYNEWVLDSVDGAKKTFGSTVAASTDPDETALTGPVANTIVFDAIPLPVGAVVVGGELIIEQAFVGPTAMTLLAGTAADTAAYLASTSLLGAADTRAPLLLTSALDSNGGANVRLTVGYTVANATAGKARVNVAYIIDGRANEVAVG